MPQKSWNHIHKGIAIRFENKWSFSGRCEETLYINDMVVSHAKVDTKKDSIAEFIFGRHYVEHEYNGVYYEIEIQAGTKWPGIFIGCHIFVDGELVGGDVKSRLIFKQSEHRDNEVQ